MSTVIDVAGITAQLRAAGLQSQPLRMYDEALQPAIDAIRKVNLGIATTTEIAPVLQHLLDPLGPPIDPADVCLTGTIDPTFTVAYDVADPFTIDVTFATSPWSVGVPSDYVTIEGSEGGRTQYDDNFRWTYDKLTTSAWVKVSIDVAGGHWEHIEYFAIPENFLGDPPDVQIPPAITEVVVSGYDVTLTGQGESNGQYLVTWGNGDVEAFKADGNGDATLNYTYPADGNYPVTITSKDGSSSIFGLITVPGDFTYTKPAPTGRSLPTGDDAGGTVDPDPTDLVIAPTEANTKDEIIEWLRDQGIDLSDKAKSALTKAELLDLVESVIDDDADAIGQVTSRAGVLN